MGLKTRQAQTGKIPFMLVLGDREIEEEAVAVRKYGEQKSETMAQSALLTVFEALDAEKVPAKLRG
jgi:threonyl-tRNA synthetase